MTPGNTLNSSRYFWWLAPLQFLFQYFYWLFLLIAIFFIPIIKIWWWLFFPIILYFPLRKVYLHWIEWDIWYKKQEWAVYEIIPPKEIEKPFKAMEDVLELLWAVYDGPNWREVWCEGELKIGGGLWISFEIVSDQGEVHFYVRMPKGFKNTFESSFHAHYPEIEFKEVEDYVKKVPKDIPNEKYDLAAEHFRFFNKHCYPIKTYPMFFEERGEMVKEEKRLDPLNSLLENMSQVGPYQQYWMQFILIPIINEVPWREEGKEIISKIARRASPKSESTLTKEVKKIIEVPPFPFTSEAAERASARAIPVSKSESGELEMVITPRERMILSGVENKLSKKAFIFVSRGLYIWRKDKPFNSGMRKIGRTYFNHFTLQDMNFISFSQLTRTRIHYVLRDRRLYLRKRRQFRTYINRFPPFWPEMYSGLETPIISTEEAATIFHFPTKVLLPSVPRIQAKPGGPPPGLPIE